MRPGLTHPFIPGYKLIRNRHGGGVLLCVNDSMNSFRILDGSDFDIEAITIRLNLYNNVIVISSIYRPPSANVTYYQNTISYIDKVYPLDLILFSWVILTSILLIKV